jgi:hypothetical protein
VVESATLDQTGGTTVADNNGVEADNASNTM